MTTTDEQLESEELKAANLKIKQLIRSLELMKRSRAEYMRLYREARNALPFSWAPPEKQK